MLVRNHGVTVARKALGLVFAGEDLDVGVAVREHRQRPSPTPIGESRACGLRRSGFHTGQESRASKPLGIMNTG